MRVFDEPIKPDLLIDRLAIDVRFEKLSDDQLIDFFRYTMFTAVLGRYKYLRFYEWTEKQESTLIHAGSPSQIGEILSLLQHRRLLDVAQNSYAISQTAICEWIKQNQKEAINVRTC